MFSIAPRGIRSPPPTPSSAAACAVLVVDFELSTEIKAQKIEKNEENTGSEGNTDGYWYIGGQKTESRDRMKTSSHLFRWRPYTHKAMAVDPMSYQTIISRSKRQVYDFSQKIFRNFLLKILS